MSQSGMLIMLFAAFFAINTCIFFWCALTHQHLLSSFRARYPEAEQAHPRLFDGIPNAEQIVFFYTARGRDLLKTDRWLLRLRRRLVLLTCLSLTAPFVTLGLVAWGVRRLL
jgi:hypothetical protein